MRVLLVEDEPRAAQMLAKGLREQAAITEPDAIILDVMLPGADGVEVCRELRRGGSNVPVLMLTARDAVESRISGLDSGADDYLIKPYDFGELPARLRAVIRRGRLQSRGSGFRSRDGSPRRTAARWNSTAALPTGRLSWSRCRSNMSSIVQLLANDNSVRDRAGFETVHKRARSSGGYFFPQERPPDLLGLL